MLITKIKSRDIDGRSKTKIEWMAGPDENQNKISIESNCKLATSFTKAINKLAIHVNDICELGLADNGMKHLQVIGVSFSYPKMKLAAVITAMKILKKSDTPFVFNTPLKTEASDQINLKQNLSTDQLQDLRELIEEAEKFISSKPVQLELFDQKIKS